MFESMDEIIAYYDKYGDLLHKKSSAKSSLGNLLKKVKEHQEKLRAEFMLMAAMRGWHSEFSSSAASKDRYAHADKIKAEVDRAKPMLELEPTAPGAAEGARAVPTTAASRLLRAWNIDLAVAAMRDSEETELRRNKMLAKGTGQRLNTKELKDLKKKFKEERPERERRIREDLEQRELPDSSVLRFRSFAKAIVVMLQKHTKGEAKHGAEGLTYETECAGLTSDNFDCELFCDRTAMPLPSTI